MYCTCICQLHVYSVLHVFSAVVIDLSSIEPENLGPLHLEQIPLCSFSEKGRPYKAKAKKNKKKWRKDEEHRGRKKTEGQDGERGGKKSGGEHKQVKVNYCCTYMCDSAEALFDVYKCNYMLMRSAHIDTRT